MLSIEYRPPDGWPEGLKLESKIIPGHETVTINQVGHVRSCMKRGGWGISDQWKALSIHQDRPGSPWYMKIHVGKVRTVVVAHAVIETFGPPSPGVDHGLFPIDGNLENHCHWNLEWRLKSEVSWRPMFRPSPLAHLLKPLKNKKTGRKDKLTETEIELSLNEYLRGRKLRAIWNERYKQRCHFPAFAQRVYMMRKRLHPRHVQPPKP